MKSLFCNNGILSLQECEKPLRHAGEVLIRVCRAGICSTDLEIIKGYVPGFSGILGHEFFGYVEEADNAKHIGKRVTAEINCGCEKCGYCRSGLQRHCPNRTVLGIMKKDGAFAEYIAVPNENVILIPDEISETSALFIEPLAAALEIMEQHPVSPDQTVLLVGDGRLAQLIGCVFLSQGIPLSAVGKHAAKLGLLKQLGAKTFLLDDFTPSPFDIVIEASGKPSGFELALACVKPRGTIVLKSTYAESFALNPSPIVVNEITIIGSRCGRFSEAIRFLLKFKPDLSYLISARYPFSKALEAFEKAKGKDVLKVVLEMQ
ncbi:MAG: alcohol dehydrogenase catalytic domain-containing protein [Chitinispirillaceae bacterium]|jgi:threonine dehydrogenase-like Zn-dependent dehydrogenase